MGRILAIVGRPNVGKSTFFNRLTESRDAIVDETAGVTRDRHYGKSEWCGVEFNVIDTGGYVDESDDIFEEQINKQVIKAIEECDAIVFMTDIIQGLSDLDKRIADLIRRISKPVFLVANKADNNRLVLEANEFYELGMGTPYTISSASGSGTGDLLDAIIEVFKNTEPEPELNAPKIAIVGRPNVGKSTLVNALMDEDRNIVTPIAGTTRDTIYSYYNKFGHQYYLVDTAGIRRKAKVNEDIEFYSMVRTIKAIENSDVCLLILDAEAGVVKQDLSIFQVIKSNNKGVVILVNKWDTVEKSTNTARDYELAIKTAIAPFNDIPILFISAIEKQRIFKVLELVKRVYDNKTRKITTSKLNSIVLPFIDHYKPSAVKGKMPKIKYVTQLPTPYPSFTFFTSHPDSVRESYKRYLENKMREKWDFCGVPMKIYMREK